MYLVRQFIRHKYSIEHLTDSLLDDARICSVSPTATKMPINSCACGLSSQTIDEKLCMCYPLLKLTQNLSYTRRSNEFLNPSCVGTTGENVSTLSIDSTNLECMKKLKQLVENEKQMINNIQELKNREYVYISTLKQVEIMCGDYKQASKYTNNGELETKMEIIYQQLLNENEKLNRDLKQIQYELKHYMTNVETPIYHELEEEKKKSQQLEHTICNATNYVSAKECVYVKEFVTLQEQLNCTCQTLGELNSNNEMLKREMCILNCKYNNLKKDLFRQKRSEANTLQRLSENIKITVKNKDMEIPVKNKNEVETSSMSYQTTAPAKFTCVLEDACACSLGEIAKDISNTLENMDSCSSCCQVPEELISIVDGIRDIATILDKKRNKSVADNEDDNSKPERGPSDDTEKNQINNGEKNPSDGTEPEVLGTDLIEVEDKIFDDRNLLQMENLIEEEEMAEEKESATGEILDTEGTKELITPRGPEMQVSAEVTLLKEDRSGVNVTAQIKNSGTLEVITEGPDRVIETTLSYSYSGNIEVITKIKALEEQRVADKNAPGFRQMPILRAPENQYNVSRLERDKAICIKSGKRNGIEFVVKGISGNNLIVFKETVIN